MRELAALLAGAIVFSGGHAQGARPTYGEIQRAFGVVSGHALHVVVWHEECAGRGPSSRQAFEQPFANWKARNAYMDELKTKVFMRAQLEGGAGEAKRLSEEMQSYVERRAETLRKELKARKDMECGRLLYILSRKQYDMNEHYKREVDTVMRAVD